MFIFNFQLTLCVKVKDMVLNLNESIYGQAEAPCLWYKNTKIVLEERGFKESDAYPCVFVSNKFI